MTRKKIEIGERYGILTVKNKYMNKGGVYVCTCEKCGGQYIANATQILKYQNSGCTPCRKKINEENNKKKMREKYMEMVGMRFGDLTVIDYIGQKPGKTGALHQMALCKCEKCGSNTEINIRSLTGGKSKQCKKCNKEGLKKGQEITEMASVDGTLIFGIRENRALNSNNTTGYKGISKKGNGYRAYIKFKRKYYHLGTYKNLDDAVAARKKAEDCLFGEFLEWYKETYPKEWEIINKKQG